MNGILVQLTFGAYHLPKNDAPRIPALKTWYEALSGSAQLGTACGLYGLRPHSSYKNLCVSADYGY